MGDDTLSQQCPDLQFGLLTNDYREGVFSRTPVNYGIWNPIYSFFGLHAEYIAFTTVIQRDNQNPSRYQTNFASFCKINKKTTHKNNSMNFLYQTARRRYGRVI